MKHIGFTTEGNDLVELGKEEYAEFVRLHREVEGGSGLPSFGIDPRVTIDFDFTNTFQVIRAWWLLRMNINNIQFLIDDLKRGLGG
jgi:hypothetical protein